jgi:hypothetical protein
VSCSVCTSSRSTAAAAMSLRTDRLGHRREGGPSGSGGRRYLPTHLFADRSGLGGEIIEHWRVYHEAPLHRPGRTLRSTRMAPILRSRCLPRNQASAGNDLGLGRKVAAAQNHEQPDSGAPRAASFAALALRCSASVGLSRREDRTKRLTPRRSSWEIADRATPICFPG